MAGEIVLLHRVVSNRADVRGYEIGIFAVWTRALMCVARGGEVFRDRYWLWNLVRVGRDFLFFSFGGARPSRVQGEVRWCFVIVRWEVALVETVGHVGHFLVGELVWVGQSRVFV